LGVKPAFEDVDARVFLAFHLALLKTKSSPTMTERRKLVLEFIRAYVRLHGVPPSYEVIAKGIGLRSKSNIHRIIHRLKADGHLVTKPYKFHAIKLVDQSVAEIASL
jgi:SOS-response transcriptional repressor LexA